MPQHAGVFADIGMKHVPAAFSDRIFAIDSGDSFGSPVEGGDSPVGIDRKNPLVDGIQNDVTILTASFCVHTPAFRRFLS
jgi:hypothetical protein